MGFHPYTDLEQLVFDVDEAIVDLLTTYPGSDFKIMAARLTDEDENETIRVTVAKAFVCSDVSEYYDRKARFIAEIRDKYPDIEINVNVADRGAGIFNTEWGTSLEGGDSGMTGRGNRRNGLITPFRPMTLEAYHGKNKRTHIGRIYQDRAFELAQKENAEIVMYNEIGRNIEDYYWWVGEKLDKNK